MRTPAGKECKYYYADFHRGRNVQVCRLIEKNPDSEPWKPKLCEKCSVPEVLWGNQSNTLKLTATVESKWMGFKKVVTVEGWCSECFSEVPNPIQGCPNCNANRPSIFG